MFVLFTCRMDDLEQKIALFVFYCKFLAIFLAQKPLQGVFERPTARLHFADIEKTLNSIPKTF